MSHRKKCVVWSFNECRTLCMGKAPTVGWVASRDDMSRCLGYHASEELQGVNDY